MQTDILTRLADEIKQDEHKEKICLIEDIFKVYNCLAGAEVCAFKSIIANSGTKFNELYDLTIEQLEVEEAIMRTTLRRRMIEISDIDKE